MRKRRRIRDFVAEDLGSSPLLAMDPICSPGGQSLPITEPLSAHLYKWGAVNDANLSQVRPASRPAFFSGLWESIEVTGLRAQEMTSGGASSPAFPLAPGAMALIKAICFPEATVRALQKLGAEKAGELLWFP